MGELENIAYEIAMLRKEGVSVKSETYLEGVEVTLARDPEHDAAIAATWDRIGKALERQNELLAAQNDLLAEAILDRKPRPRSALDRVPDVIIVTAIIVLLLSLGTDLVRAIW